MNDKMTPIPFKQMVNWVMKEYKDRGTLFGIHHDKIYRNKSNRNVELFGEKIASPIGPAAGPNTQLAQNIVAAYLTGSRFIELKTVQIIDGEDLPVQKPCIACVDECYNVEWSTELKVEDAFNEYIKAWFLLHILMKELNISKTRDFMFNMSVGYDLDGIKSPKINAFIDGMVNAKTTKIWQECTEYISSNLKQFTNFTLEDLNDISANICPSITLSTLHGCPPEEIERIASYLLEDKGLHTFVKMNPTLLGEDFVASTLTKMGYEYMLLNPNHFKNDLQYDDAIDMLKRLKAIAKKHDLEMGVKLTNTLPVKITKDELPGEEMYMSGRALYPLTIQLASRLANEFAGDLLISYSGGADYFNIDQIFSTGIQPVTFATTILKPGGYERITQMAYKVEKHINPYISKIDVSKLTILADLALKDMHYAKAFREVKNRKLNKELPLFDCAISPCTNGCPINQQIPEYISLIEQKKYDEAFSIIMKDNAAPAITGSICPHTCQSKCTRIDYDKSVNIRNMKRVAVDHKDNNYLSNITPKPLQSKKKVGIIGAGPAGLSAAYYLRRNGLDVTVMDKRDEPFGTVRYIIPDFRISDAAIHHDFELIKRQGVHFKFGVNEKFSIHQLKEDYDYLILAMGATKPGKLSLTHGVEQATNAIEFLASYKENKEDIDLGENVLVIGGGDVAMDASRAAKRISGVKNVSIVYRRTKEYMPASREELNDALNDDINVKELLSPVDFKNGKLHCEVMQLGEMDDSGRRKPIQTGKIQTLDCDSLIIAIGEKIHAQPLKENGIALDNKDLPVLNQAYQTNLTDVYIAGDLKNGPKTIVEAMADSKIITKDILRKEGLKDDFDKINLPMNEDSIYAKKGIVSEPFNNKDDAKRCLSCGMICELCVDVCPNRANMVINVAGKHQIIHLDGMCNECGNCAVFCPYSGRPYKDKLTVFWSEEEFNASTNVGFMVLNLEEGFYKVRNNDGEIIEYTVGEVSQLSNDLIQLIDTCHTHYEYILGGERC